MSFIMPNKKNFLSKDLVFVFFILLICAMLVFKADYRSAYAQDVERARARVLSVENSDLQTFGIVTTGSQGLQVSILNGPHKGEIIQAHNVLIGKMETDKVFLEGDTALLVLSENEAGEITNANAYDHYRISIEIILVVIFALLLISFAGWSGVKSLLSFVLALLMVWKVLLPGIMSGQDPILISFLVVFVIAFVTLFLVAGISKIAIVALIGASLGILLTIGLSQLIFPFFKLHGAIQPFSETLLYTGFEWLDLTKIFLAAVFIGASGAVIDVAIDISASMNEIIEKRPDLSVAELMKSGFTVGRAMTSTMVTTLLMAYISGYLSLLMVFMAQGTPPVFIFNTNYVTAEVLKTVVGSFGLVTVAPFTALVGSLIYAKRQPKSESLPAVKIEEGQTLSK